MVLLLILSRTLRNSIVLKKTSKIDLPWVKGHAGLRGNERADYLAKIAASYKTTIDYSYLSYKPQVSISVL